MATSGFISWSILSHALYSPDPMAILSSGTAPGGAGAGLVVVWYVFAKVLEHFDQEIYAAIKIISGHSLKHLAAAMATWWLVRMFRMKYIESK